MAKRIFLRPEFSEQEGKMAKRQHFVPLQVHSVDFRTLYVILPATCRTSFSLCYKYFEGGRVC